MIYDVLKPKNHIRQGRHIYNAQHKLIVGFTPKAACTVAAKLFFQHIGLLDEALQFHPFIHKYRQQYFPKNPVTVQDFKNPENVSIKFVRNPYTRAISGFVHCVKNSVYRDEICTKFKLNQLNQLTFKQYLQYIADLNLYSCDPHLGLQKLKKEDEVFQYQSIVQIENLHSDIASIIKQTNRNFQINEQIINSVHHTPKLKKFEGFVGQTSYVAFADKRNKIMALPPYANFYDEELIELVLNIFQPDFKAYGYSHKINF